jgi:hypothetical protein
MMRVLVAITPQMYRQDIAFAIWRQRPGCEVRVAAPETIKRVLANFRPHLLVHNDSDGFGPEELESVPCRVTVLYSDGMDARISADDRVSKARDLSIHDLLQVVDVAIALVDG